MVLTRRWTSLASTATPRGKVSEEKVTLVSVTLSHTRSVSFLFFFFLFQLLRGEQVIGAMSRKKAVKGKGGSKSPKASPSSGRTGKGLAAAAAPSSGLVYPSRPSLSNSGEFYDIAFKVSSEFRHSEFFLQSSHQLVDERRCEVRSSKKQTNKKTSLNCNLSGIPVMMPVYFICYF